MSSLMWTFTQGLQWVPLTEEEIVPRILAMEGRRGRPPNPDQQQSPGEGSQGGRRRKGRPPNVGMGLGLGGPDFPSPSDAKLLRKLEAQGGFDIGVATPSLAQVAITRAWLSLSLPIAIQLRHSLNLRLGSPWVQTLLGEQGGFTRRFLLHSDTYWLFIEIVNQQILKENQVNRAEQGWNTHEHANEHTHTNTFEVIAEKM